MIKCLAFRKIYLLFIGFCGLLIVFVRCVDKSNLPVSDVTKITDWEGNQFAGINKCIACHSDIVNSFNANAHLHTSAQASDETIKGSFKDGLNVFDFNYFDKVWLTKKEDAYYQIAVHKKSLGEAQRFDIVIGSGNRGQSYLYWKQDKLFQLPISYYTPSDSWSNSPGYTDYTIKFNRGITPRCLECHSTFAKASNLNQMAYNRFDKTQIVYGITCEKCHGPAAKHVAFHEANPGEKKPFYITNSARMSRQQQLDQCGLCHSGLQENIQPAFLFKPGDTLSNFFKMDNNPEHTSNLDAHGNRFALLSVSKCFLKSPQMTCSTCHNTHNNERGNLTLFSQRCLSCHGNDHTKKCTVKINSEIDITTNCIDCHMPERASNNLTVRLPNDRTVTPAILRTHKIAIYPEETKKVVAFMKTYPQKQL